MQIVYPTTICTLTNALIQATHAQATAAATRLQNIQSGCKRIRIGYAFIPLLWNLIYGKWNPREEDPLYTIKLASNFFPVPQMWDPSNFIIVAVDEASLDPAQPLSQSVDMDKLKELPVISPDAQVYVVNGRHRIKAALLIFHDVIRRIEALEKELLNPLSDAMRVLTLQNLQEYKDFQANFNWPAIIVSKGRLLIVWSEIICSS
jgi:hypothetical protein